MYVLCLIEEYIDLLSIRTRLGINTNFFSNIYLYYFILYILEIECDDNEFNIPQKSLAARKKIAAIFYLFCDSRSATELL